MKDNKELIEKLNNSFSKLKKLKEDMSGFDPKNNFLEEFDISIMPKVTEESLIYVKLLGDSPNAQKILEKLLEKEMINREFLIDFSIMFLYKKGLFPSSAPLSHPSFISDELNEKYLIGKEIRNQSQKLDEMIFYSTRNEGPPFFAAFDLLPSNSTNLKVTAETHYIIIEILKGNPLLSEKTHFNEETGELYIKGKKVKIKKTNTENTKELLLLKLLFKSKNRMVYIGDIFKFIEGHQYDKYRDNLYYKKIHSVVTSINKKIEKETGIEEAIKPTSLTVSLDKKLI